ncbi:MAG: hypothetical protein ACLU0O_01890 [Collinsella sp.]
MMRAFERTNTRTNPLYWTLQELSMPTAIPADSLGAAERRPIVPSSTHSRARSCLPARPCSRGCLSRCPSYAL